jgi:pimeloyl-ACP methyl ester carboxylesterase
MRKILAALCAAALTSHCSRTEPPPAPAPTAEPARPTEGAARIAIAPDGVHVQYRVYGSGDPTLVLIHGWSCDSNYWREQLPVLKQKYTVVTVDLAGHGGTDANRSNWSIAAFGQDVATAMGAVPSRRLILVGHSMGGPVALEAARLLGDRVVGIVGLDTFKTIGGAAPTPAQVDAIVKPFEADFIGHTRSLVTDHLFRSDGNRELAGKIAYDMSLSSPRIAIPSLRALFEYDLTAAAKDVKVPIVVINSDMGEPINEARVRKLLPGFRAVTLEKSGHFVMMEDPGRLNAALLSELEALHGAPGS